MENPPKSIKNRSLELKWAREQLKTLQKREVLSLHDKWFDGQDVMMALRISRRTLQKYRNNGLLPFVRLTGKLYYKVRDVYSLLESRYKKSKKSKKNE